MFVLLELPLEFTFQALLELLVFGERSHQLVADYELHPNTKTERSYCLVSGVDGWAFALAILASA